MKAVRYGRANGEPLAATVLGDERAVVMRPLAEDDRVALLAILKTGAAEAPVSYPILCRATGKVT